MRTTRWRHIGGDSRLTVAQTGNHKHLQTSDGIGGVVDIAMGVSIASPTVCMVLTGGESADGTTIEHETFDVPAGEAVSDQVVTAIRQARRGAAAAGHRISSVGVAFSDPIEGDLLRDALARQQVDDVMVVSAFLAAVALTQSAGSALGDAHTALLYVTPTSATVATVNSADGAIADVHRHRLGEGELADELAELVSCVEDVPEPPGGVFVVGSGVALAAVKSRLEEATSLPVSFPGEPELALARGAGLASAHAPLFASSTQAMAWAQDLGTGAVDLEALRAAAVPSPVGGTGIDYGATSDNAALAYSALPDNDYPDLPVAEGAGERLDSAQLDFHSHDQESRNPVVLAVSGAAAVAMIAIAALVVSVVAGDGSSKTPPPRTGAHAVPSQEAAPPKPEAPPSPKPEAPPPAPEAPAPEVPAPQAPAPEPQAPAPQAPAVQAPPPAPAAPPPPPPPPQLPVFVPIPIPGAPDIGGPGGPKGRDKKPWSPPRGSDRGHGHDDDWSPKLPFIGGDDHGHGKLKIPGIPGF